MEVEETDKTLAVGTGFIYEYEEAYYLITNGHNLTGVNPETNTRLTDHAAFPTRLSMTVRYEVQPEFDVALREGDVMTGPGEFTARLYRDDDYTQPFWYIHPKHGYNVDVVALFIGSKTAHPENLIIRPLNTYSGFSNPKGFEATPEVADDVYILGYPFGITHKQSLPIWKRGSIATEPEFDYKVGWSS